MKLEPRVNSAQGILALLQEYYKTYYRAARETRANRGHFSKIMTKGMQPRYSDVMKWLDNAGLCITPWGLAEKELLENYDTPLPGLVSELPPRW
jgi:hypothetical protein